MKRLFSNKELSDKKEGYADHQLIETDRDEAVIKRKIAEIYDECH
ncbi:MAG: hypothetical protein ACMUIU_01715 [bacterium]